MKKSNALYISLFFMALLSLNSALATDNQSSYSFNKLSESLCQTAQNNQLTKMRIKLRNARTHISTVYADVDCEGRSLLNIARLHQSDKIVAYLKRKARAEEIDAKLLAAK